MAISILLVGATGLIGQGVLKTLCESTRIGKIVLLVRKPVRAADDRVRVVRVDAFSDDTLRELDLSGLDACIYCAGPLPLGMSAQSYRDVTVDLTHWVAAAYAAANPHGRLIYVSGLGAEPQSRLSPLKIKGEAETMLSGLGIATTCLRPGIVRPVLGEISPHRWRRWAYRLGDPLMALGRTVLPSVFTTTREVGMAALWSVFASSPPAILENAQINANHTIV